MQKNCSSTISIQGDVPASCRYRHCFCFTHNWIHPKGSLLSFPCSGAPPSLGIKQILPSGLGQWRRKHFNSILGFGRFASSLKKRLFKIIQHVTIQRLTRWPQLQEKTLLQSVIFCIQQRGIIFMNMAYRTVHAYCILTIFHLGTNIFEKTFLLETQIYFDLEQNYFWWHSMSEGGLLCFLRGWLGKVIHLQKLWVLFADNGEGVLCDVLHLYCVLQQFD